MISVLLPAFNAKEYIAEAVESVLRQTYQDFEIIVVDDGSTDGTQTVVKSFSNQVQYHYQENSGAAAARNHCIRLARGEFLAFLDADDIWSDDKLELQIREFNEDSSLEAVFGMVRQVLQKDWKKKILENNAPSDELFEGYVQGTMLIKRESFLRIGTFSEENTIGEFVDWFLRARESDLRMKLLPNLFLWRRIHHSNIGVRRRSEIGDYVRILKRSIDRRRANALNIAKDK